MRAKAPHGMGVPAIVGPTRKRAMNASSDHVPMGLVPGSGVRFA